MLEMDQIRSNDGFCDQASLRGLHHFPTMHHLSIIFLPSLPEIYSRWLNCIYSLHIQAHTYRVVVMPTFRGPELGHSVARMSVKLPPRT
ncbi:uncharacterized protein BO87DRAFT_94510 [Aspergillus neoniger CBS 115656]|uniref:Uncharacterized protein n=1 Tax=Aspergillus neoniger (strain CBS 115656) TaxID=1448310 RepID=A0A318Z929_ASPNB|nr:hypothetical protein BO87DRAFT_94510 [Aspergillus neoniger CBS 115656]PYH33142.1 hypothetical protein BO87DRAFT_94510 [Aspergillus neoniger CBS 115656]